MYSSSDRKRFNRFMKKLKPNDCWLWEGVIAPNGYGVFSIKGKSVSAHRTAYILAYGNTQNGMWVLHHCDNKRCVNPGHLFLGTAKDNTRDMIEKGRNAISPGCSSENASKGEAHYAAKLTEKDVLWIRNVYKPRHRKYGQRALARRFSVNLSTIIFVLNRITWKHI